MANRRNRIRLIVSLSVLAAVCGEAVIHTTAVAQQTPSIAAVTGNNVYVRSGPADSYYPFGRLHHGNLVEVIGEKFNWARITVRGPSFTAGTDDGEFFGYIIHPKTDTGALRITNDGTLGTTLGRIDVLAPNLNTNFNPGDSWKPLIRLDANSTVHILSSIETSQNVVHYIVLPENAEAWISKAYLRDAIAEEVAAWSTTPADATVTGTREIKEPTASTDAQVPSKSVEQPVLAREQTDVTQDAEATSENATDGPEELPKPTLAEQVAKATLDDLEGLFEKLRRTPAEIAEVGHLRQMYLDLAARHDDEPTAVRFATARAEQLQIWQDIREKQAEVDRLRNRARVTAERAESAQLAVYSHTNYDAIGRLAASTIYDGKRLPPLLRLREPGTGRTLAYIEPETEEFDLFEMIGQWVGIVGDKEYDPALRLNIITPKRIDLLAPQ